LEEPELRILKMLFPPTNEEGYVFVIWDNGVAVDVSHEIRLII
jgi:hypothetical protein